MTRSNWIPTTYIYFLIFGYFCVQVFITGCLPSTVATAVVALAIAPTPQHFAVRMQHSPDIRSPADAQHLSPLGLVCELAEVVWPGWLRRWD